MKNFLRIAACAGALMMTAATFGGEPKVTICHYPPGNPSNFQVITVGASAAAEHIAQHGDNLPGQGATMQCPGCGICPGPGGE